MECDLLQYLVKNGGKAVSRKSILRTSGTSTRTPTPAPSTISSWRLRRYLEADPTKPKHLVTVRGVGYKFIQ